MASNEEQVSAQLPQQHGEEMEEELSEAQETGEAKGTGVSPGHAGQAHVGDRPAEGGQVPPA